MLQVKNLGMVYPDGTRALEDLSFSVKRGEFLVVIGLSGSGKSTLLRCINRLLDPAEGDILLNGKNISAINNKARKAEESRKIREKARLLRDKAKQENKLAKTGEERRQNKIRFKEELDKLKLEEEAAAAKIRDKKLLEKERLKKEDIEFRSAARTGEEKKAYRAKRKEDKAQQKDLGKIRRKIGMIFQHFNLVKRSNVMTNVLSGRLGYVPQISSIFHRFPEADRKKAKEALEMVGLTEQARKRADELSGGQQQRVGIARALMQDPDIILADEPVASLDPVLAHTILGYLEKLNKEQGITIICSLHYLDLVQRYATRVIGLKAGKLVYEGTGKDIKNMTDAEFKEIYGEEAVRINASLTGDMA